MFDLLKKGFNDIRIDLIQDILKIEGESYQIVFTFLFFIILILLFLFGIKNGREAHQLIKHNKKVRKNIERQYFEILSGKDKNKEKGNI
jgi:uncharacterized membrane protein